MLSARALELVRRAGGTVTAKELIDAGVRWEDLYALRDAGSLVEISRGVYRLADAPLTAHLDFVAVCRRAPHATICLNSAASYWDLTDELPTAVHLAVARGRRPPSITYPPTTLHVFAAPTFELGRVYETVESGDVIAITSPERTVVDYMRMHGRVGRDQALGTLRRYLAGPHARPGELLSLARKLRAGTLVAAAMEPLLA
jgi:predicted transcriptional regulator of viral defense system